MNLLPVLLGVLLLAFATGSESLSYLAYLIVGVIVFSRLWLDRATRSVHAERCFSPRAFFGEHIPVELEIFNRGRLPIPWLVIHESLPPALHVPSIERRVISLAPRERTTLRYDLNCQRRGYYRLGPLFLRSGDLLSLSTDWQGQRGEDELIVYPKIIALPLLQLPSQIPFGDLATRTRFFEDPSRFFGLRQYQPGDSLRLVDWKSSARLASLQVKRFEPAVALHAAIMLDLNGNGYSLRARLTSEDLGCTIAASIAARLIDLRQHVGLSILGKDDLTEHQGLLSIRPARGREHLMQLLEALARARMGKTRRLAQVLPTASIDWGWGTSVVLITSGSDPELSDGLLQLRRRGFNVMIFITDDQARFRELEERMAPIGVPAYWITQEKELDLWR